MSTLTSRTTLLAGLQDALAALPEALAGKVRLGAAPSAGGQAVPSAGGQAVPSAGGQAAPGAATASSRQLSTGLPQLDALLQGGVPKGAVTEVLGRGASGRLSVALGVLRAVALGGGVRAPQGVPQGAPNNSDGRLAAYVDVSRTVFPQEVWARGGRLLVVRPLNLADGVRALDVLLSSGCFAAIVLDASATGLRQGLPEAVGVRLVRLARETDAAVLLLGERVLLPGLAALRLELVPASPGTVLAEVRKCRRGTPGSVLLPLWDAVRESLAVSTQTAGDGGARPAARHVA